MGKRKGAKYAVVERFNELMADGQKRSEAKTDARACGEFTFGFTTGKIHAFETRNNYQKIVMRFIDWCRDQQSIRDPEQIQAHADELVSLYLTERIEKGYSAWTLTTERSAFRMYFGNRQLAMSVALPLRKRENIKRSRIPAKRDQHFNPENWLELVKFVQASGLRREELRDLRVRDIYVRPTDEKLVVRVVKGKGGKKREVEPFPSREADILAVKAGRHPDEKVFAQLPSAMDIHSYRRRFAQELYEHLSGRPLPPLEGRLQSTDFDRDSALIVSQRLGHGRVDIIFGHYIR